MIIKHYLEKKALSGQKGTGINSYFIFIFNFIFFIFFPFSYFFGSLFADIIISTKVLFIVDKIPLVLQQAEAVKNDIGGSWHVEKVNLKLIKKVLLIINNKYCGDLGAIKNWKVAIESAHVIVVIAQILVNCLVLNPSALSDVDLMVKYIFLSFVIL